MADLDKCKAPNLWMLGHYGSYSLRKHDADGKSGSCLTGGNPGATAYRADVVDDVLKAGPSFLPTKNIWCLK